MAVWCVFCYQSVCVFLTNGVSRKLFTMFFITTICVYDFCEMLTVLVKKSTPCQGMIWIFPSKMLYFYTGFLMVLHKLTCEPWNAKKKVEGAALKLPPGLTTLWFGRGARRKCRYARASKSTRNLCHCRRKLKEDTARLQLEFACMHPCTTAVYLHICTASCDRAREKILLGCIWTAVDSDRNLSWY